MNEGELKKMSSNEMIETTRTDPACSYWLRRAVQEAILRDPLDALIDVEWLALLLKKRIVEIQSGARP